MRSDGNFVMYVLEAQNTVGKDKKWFRASLDYFGTPKGFGPSGECWQQTGEHAVFDKKQGFRALELMSEHYPELGWRLMKLKFSQEHSLIAEIAAGNPGVRDPDSGTPEHYRRARAVSA